VVFLGEFVALELGRRWETETVETLERAVGLGRLECFGEQFDVAFREEWPISGKLLEIGRVQ